MNIYAKLDEAKRYIRGSLTAIFDCKHWHNGCLKEAIDYLPQKLCDNNQVQLLFLSTAEQTGCRVAREYCSTCEIILISERAFPIDREVAFGKDDPAARYFIFVVLHEVAHAIRQHKSPLFDELSTEEIESQENEADELAMEWFKDHAEELKYPAITKGEITVAEERQLELMKQLKLMKRRMDRR